MFEYVHVKGEGNKGASYKYTWKPSWKMPPGVKGSVVLLQVCGWLSLAAVPVYIYPMWRGPKTEDEKKADVRGG